MRLFSYQLGTLPQIRAGAILDLIVDVLELLNLPIPDEEGLVEKVKAIGLKLGK